MPKGIARIGSALVFNMVGLFASKGSTFITQLIISRMLGATEYGKASIVVNTTLVFASMAAMGLGILSTRFVAELKKTDVARLNRILGMTVVVGASSSVLFAFGLFVFSDVLAAYQLGDSSTAPYLRIAAFTVAFTTYNGIQRGSLVGLEAFKSVMIVDLISGIVNVTLGPLLAYQYSVYGYISALALGAGLTNLVYWVVSRQKFQAFGLKPDPRGVKSEIRLLRTFALPTMLASMLAGPVNWACGVILVNTPNGFAEYGLYSAAFQWRTIINTVLTTFGNAMLPILVSSKETNQTIERISLLTEWVVAIVAAAIIVPFTRIIARMYGASYDPVVFSRCAIALMAACVASSFFNGVTRKAIQQQAMWTAFLGNLIWAVATVSFTFGLLDYGCIGLAWAGFLGYVVQIAFMLAVLSCRGLFNIHLLLNIRVGLSWLLFGLWIAISSTFDLFVVKLSVSLMLIAAISYIFGTQGIAAQGLRIIKAHIAGKVKRID